MAIVHFILCFMEIITRTSLLLVSVYDKLESESGLLANGPTRSHFSFADTTSTNILFFAILLCNLWTRQTTFSLLDLLVLFFCALPASHYVTMPHSTSAQPSKLFFFLSLSQTPLCHNSHSKSLQYHQFNSGEITQCTQFMHETYKRINSMQ